MGKQWGTILVLMDEMALGIADTDVSGITLRQV